MGRRITTEDLSRTQSLNAAMAAEELGVHVESLRRARRRARTTPDFTRARSLLADGATYPEVARTVGISAPRLRRALPGYDATAEHRRIMAAILQTPALHRLHTEMSQSRSARRA